MSASNFLACFNETESFEGGYVTATSSLNSAQARLPLPCPAPLDRSYSAMSGECILRRQYPTGSFARLANQSNENNECCLPVLLASPICNFLVNNRHSRQFSRWTCHPVVRPYPRERRQNLCSTYRTLRCRVRRIVHSEHSQDQYSAFLPPPTNDKLGMTFVRASLTDWRAIPYASIHSLPNRQPSSRARSRIQATSNHIRKSISHEYPQSPGHKRDHALIQLTYRSGV